MHALRITLSRWRSALYGEFSTAMLRDTERTGRQKQSAVHVEINCAALKCSFIHLQHSSDKDGRNNSQSCTISLVLFSVVWMKKVHPWLFFSFLPVRCATSVSSCEELYVRKSQHDICLSSDIRQECKWEQHTGKRVVSGQIFVFWEILFD